MTGLRLPISLLEPKMRIKYPLFGPNGELLLTKGRELSASSIVRIQSRDIPAVYVEVNPEFTALEAPQDLLSEFLFVDLYMLVRQFVESGGSARAFDLIESHAASLVDELLFGKVSFYNLAPVSAAEFSVYAHSVDVCIMAVIAGVSLHFSRSSLIDLAIGCLLHDTGEIRADGRPLLLEKEHPLVGWGMLKKLDRSISPTVLSIVKSHHERMDGSGYPEELMGKGISNSVYLCAVADFYSDAILSHDRYVSACDAYDMLRATSDRLFPAQLVDKFLALHNPFPVGTLARLNTMEIAYVIESNLAYPSAPKVLVIDSNNVVKDLSRDTATYISKALLPSEIRRVILLTGEFEVQFDEKEQFDDEEQD